jgi:hypothetical protein
MKNKKEKLKDLRRYVTGLGIDTLDTENIVDYVEINFMPQPTEPQGWSEIEREFDKVFSNLPLSRIDGNTRIINTDLIKSFFRSKFNKGGR